MFTTVSLSEPSKSDTSSGQIQVGDVLNKYVTLGMAKQTRNRIRATCAERLLRRSRAASSMRLFSNIACGTPAGKIGAPKRVKEAGLKTFMPGIRESNRETREFESKPLEKISHLAVLTTRPISFRRGMRNARSRSTTSGLPPMVPSSKYQMLSGDSSSVMIFWIARLKTSGPRGSPCWAPTWDKMSESPKKRLDGAPYSWKRKLYNEGILSLASRNKLSLSKELKAF
ncbi:hypothetical protein O0L34_g12896 [Tuta absoluta]|nr:hypothetical protein O0L34_g12896 [Tuta absoluta]